MLYGVAGRRARTRAAWMMMAGLLVSVCASAADFSGKWSGSAPQAGSLYAVLKQDGTTLTGSAGPNESRQFPIVTGKVEGDHLLFEVKMAGGEIRFDLTAAGPDLKGTIRLSEDGGQHTANDSAVLSRVAQ